MLKLDFTFLALVFTALALVSCKSLRNYSKMTEDTYFIDVQGHRGFRGLFPENTIIGFKKAVDIGVTTLELDVVCSKDHQLIISHEPYFSHTISKTPSGVPIEESNEKDFALYQLTYKEIQAFDVGSKMNPGFPNQRKIRAYKPSLADMVTVLEDYTKGDIRYNIELKRKPEWDSIFLPTLEAFVDICLSTLKILNIEDRTTIQSFDLECLKLLKRKTQIPLVFLVENSMSIEENLELLGFTPEVYSPNFRLVTKEMVAYCHTRSMKLIPWTVNKEGDIEKMISLGVDGIISDYPNVLVEIINSNPNIEILR